jgi:hypothetical protein
MKSALAPVLNERTYSYLQAVSKAIDIRKGSGAEPELDLIPFAVHPGDTVLDLGANYGYYTYPLSRAVGTSGRVYAFEPVPFTYATLALVTRLLGLRNVVLVQKGCSDAAGVVEFRVPVQNLSLIKCDIEGAELLAFRGAARTIERHRPSVICEINPWFLDGFGLRLEDLIAFFVDRGYQLYRYTREKTLVPVASPASIVEDNYVFLHRDRLAAFGTLIQQPAHAHPA